jgi:hypothetical protein
MADCLGLDPQALRLEGLLLGVREQLDERVMHRFEVRPLEARGPPSIERGPR